MMSTLVSTFLAFVTSCFRSRAALQMENAMLRQERDVQTPDQGKIIEVPDLGGFHHHYIRFAA